MHLGLARTALLAWLRARSQGGALILRSEDIDGPRVVPGALEALMADLRFLGFDWDEGPDVGGPHAPYIQSQRSACYLEALERLVAEERAYPCRCSRKDLAIASAPHGEFGTIYPGTCRRAPPGEPGPHALRFVVDEPLPGFHDAYLGEIPVSAQGDFVVRRADGTFSYQLAVVVDDILMGVTEVVRGADLAGCTAWQIELYAALGAKAPGFAHVPLLLGDDGKRLAKRDRAMSVAEVRDRGVSAEQIIGALAASLGLGDGSPVSARSLIEGFTFDRIREHPFDWDALTR